MNRLARIIQQASKEDLRLLQKDLHAGNIERLIAIRLSELAEAEGKSCPVCGAHIPVNEGIRIEFGSEHLRMQAFFDGPDCAEHFLKQKMNQRDEYNQTNE